MAAYLHYPFNLLICCLQLFTNRNIDLIFCFSNTEWLQVSFAIFEEVGKNAMVTMAARTHKSYRGQGIATKLYQAGVSLFIGEHGQTLNELRVAFPVNNLDKKLEENSNWRLARKWVSKYKES